MDLTVDEFIDGLLQPHTVEIPSDTKKPDLDTTTLPEWFDEKKFNQGRKFYWANAFSMATSMLYGLVAVFAVPSILKVLIASQRSSSTYTAFRRYLSTLLHTASWFECELKPGTLSWRSLHEVRSRHFRAGVAAKAKGIGTVSQRDIALTQFGFMGFAVLKPRRLGIQQLEQGDWDAYVHFWKVIGYMIGLEDRYNICRNSYEETLEVCQKLQERVFTPALTNVPEYFEHMSRVMLDGLWCVNPLTDMDAVLYFTKWLADVPGYIYFEDERIELQKRLREHLKGKPVHTGIKSSEIVEKPAIEGLPEHGSSTLYYHDFDTLTSIPFYKNLTAYSKYRLSTMMILLNLCTYYWSRLYFNINYSYVVLNLAKYFPYLAFFRFGIKNSLVEMFVESPKDNTQPKPNSEYYKVKKSEPWYKSIFRFIFGMFGLC